MGSHLSLGGKWLLSIVAVFWLGAGLRAAEPDYPHGPDSERQPGVPEGKVTQSKFVSRKVYPGFERDMWVYVPAQYDGKEPAAVMIYQDGGGAVNPKGDLRATVVMDNLIAKKEMPVTIGIFLNPGELSAVGEKQLRRYNRSFEYDSPTPQYAQFLLEEVLPEVAKSYNLSTDPNARGLCGLSSGGICAFNAAWHRPDAFRRVVSFIGSFTNLRGANEIPDLIRKSEPKPIRVFMQDGSHDLDIYAGSWWMANQDIASALNFAGYEFEFVKGEGSHNGRHGGAVLPDALRFVWKDFSKPIATPVNKNQPILDVLLPGETWQVVSEGHKFTEGPTSDGKGNVYFTDIPNNRIHKIDESGKVSVFVENSGGANGLKFGPDGRLYACQQGKGRLVAYDANAKEEVLAEGLDQPNDLCISHDGAIYFTEPPKHRVWLLDSKKEKKVVDEGIRFPNGLQLTPDQGQLVVDDTQGANFYIFDVEKDGTLSHKQPYFTAQLPAMGHESGADGMTVDSQGRLYVTTNLGVQMFDQAGRVNGIIVKPQDAWLSNVTFGGKDMDTLYVTCGDKVYRRKTKAHGVLSFQEPILPDKPRL